jgi:hypothetical protein
MVLHTTIRRKVLNKLQQKLKLFAGNRIKVHAQQASSGIIDIDL